jgi:hypothetical protein
MNETLLGDIYNQIPGRKFWDWLPDWSDTLDTQLFLVRQVPLLYSL